LSVSLCVCAPLHPGYCVWSFSTKLAGERVTVTVVQLSEALERVNEQRYNPESALTLIAAKVAIVGT
jgi:hypothetical protein